MLLRGVRLWLGLLGSGELQAKVLQGELELLEALEVWQGFPPAPLAGMAKAGQGEAGQPV